MDNKYIKIGTKVACGIGSKGRNGLLNYSTLFMFKVTSIENGLLYNRERKIYAVNPRYVRPIIQPLPSVKSVEKPPIGLTPESIYWATCKDNRISEIHEAMLRYSEAGKVTPVKWIEELVELNKPEIQNK